MRIEYRIEDIDNAEWERGMQSWNVRKMGQLGSEGWQFVRVVDAPNKEKGHETWLFMREA